MITYTDGLFTGSWEDFYTESSSSEESGNSPNEEVIAKQRIYSISYLTIAMPTKCPKGCVYSSTFQKCFPLAPTRPRTNFGMTRRYRTTKTYRRVCPSPSYE
ncbi:hypothetical protein AND_000619 [Anopheles darlingi]|uniref:Uncharacterized protein n=1 Tax=Anopheles darlingi TaxID=43151 RepID=W5JT54_ANODA|nr:hypothetical protein AND_000619 [Anopheles darlingi]